MPVNDLSALVSGVARGFSRYTSPHHIAATAAEGSFALTSKAGFGGPLGVTGEATVAGKLEAVALQFHGEVEAAEVSWGILNAKAAAEGDINVLGVGGQFEVGVKTLESRPGFRLTAGAGLTALVGARGKVNLEVSIDYQAVRQYYEDAQRYIDGLFD